MEKPAITRYQIHEVLRKRWSPRAFAARPVEEEKLWSLFEAARWAPSGGNQQPWYFVMATAANPEEHQCIVDVLGPRNQVWARGAPVLMIAVAKTERQPGMPNRWAWYDVGQAVAHLSVQATAEGLALRQMGGFDADKARECLGIPPGFEPVVAIALGYPGDPERLPEDIRAREYEARSRKPVESFVFRGRWRPESENENRN